MQKYYITKDLSLQENTMIKSVIIQNSYLQHASTDLQPDKFIMFSASINVLLMLLILCQILGRDS